MKAILHGFQLGFIMFFLVGPVFFLLMEETLYRGKKAASILAVGLWTSDFIYALIAYFGISTFLNYTDLSYNFGYIAVFILLLAGVTSVIRKDKIHTRKNLKLAGVGNLYLKGFLLNTFNPFVIVFWIAIATQINFANNQRVVAFYTSLFVTILAGDFFKILVVSKLSKRLLPAHVAIIRAIGGVLLIVFALLLAYRIYSQGQ